MYWGRPLKSRCPPPVLDPGSWILQDSSLIHSSSSLFTHHLPKQATVNLSDTAERAWGDDDFILTNMPSKKKKAKKSKARGAAKSRKANEEVLSNDNAVNEVTQDEDALLEEAINLAAAEREQLESTAVNDDGNNDAERCNHGFSPWPRGHVCALFVQTFLREFNVSNRSNVIDRFTDMREATEKYTAVWNDPDMLQLVTSHFLAEGAGAILEENDVIIRQSATFAILFEQWRDTMTRKYSGVIRKWGKIEELSSDTCDEHTTVSFFKKRIPCKCLDKKYKEVKSIVKMGLCMNPVCPLPDRKVEVSKLMHCEQCQMLRYCSAECQKVAWPSHREHCVEISKLERTG